MPLTLEFESHSLDGQRLYGQFIIDRDNLIIRFKPQSNDTAHIMQTVTTRDRFSTLFDKNILPHLSNTTSMVDLPEHLHLLADHLSENDKLGYHSHYKFKKNIQLEDIQLIFNKIKESAELTSFISPIQCDSMYTVCESYFTEQNTPFSPAHDIEQTYRNEKQAQLERGESEFKTYLQKQEQHLLADFKIIMLPFINIMLLGSLIEQRAPASPAASNPLQIDGSSVIPPEQLPKAGEIKTSSSSLSSESPDSWDPGTTELFKRAFQRKEALKKSKQPGKITPRKQTPVHEKVKAKSKDLKPNDNSSSAALMFFQKASPRQKSKQLEKATPLINLSQGDKFKKTPGGKIRMKYYSMLNKFNPATSSLPEKSKRSDELIQRHSKPSVTGSKIP